MLSIIVPVYNVEKYLYECLDSIKNQSFKDFEVILVNDGSTDSSENILKDFCSRDNRFSFYNKPNGGLSSARNYGLNYVKGEYVTFLDSDDYLESDIYEKMMNKIESDKLDIVVSDILYFFENGSNSFISKGLNQNFEIEVSKQALLSPMFAWNKIYRTEYFKTINRYYPEGLWYEDIPVTSSLFANTQKIGYVSEVGYHYRQRETSIMGQVSDKFFDIFTILGDVINYFKYNNLYETFHSEIEYLCLEQIMLYGQYRFLKNDNYKCLYQNSIDFMHKNFKNYKSNPYIKQLGLKEKIFLKTYNRYTINVYKWYLERRR